MSGQTRLIRLRWELMHLAFCNSLLNFVLIKNLQTREVAFADDLTVVVKLADLKIFWDKISTIGPKYEYFPKSTKSYLIVKKIA